MAKKIVQSLTIGKYNVYLNISSCVGHDGNYNFQFGKGDSSLQSYGILTISQKRIAIESNIFGGKRIYYWIEYDEIFITDDVFSFLSDRDFDLMEIDIFENEYFLRHGYTSGDCTRYKKIKKIAPSSLFIVDEDGIKIESTWHLDKIRNTPDEDAFKNAIFNAVSGSLKPLVKIDRPIVLCFSGGKDSTYLATIMNQLGIVYDLVFFRDHTLKVNNKEFKMANKQARLLGKELKSIDISNLKDDETEEQIRRFNIFDRHYCRYHFYGVKELNKQYGSELIIVNGQNADSILSYGPSEEKLTSLMKRYLLYGSNMFLKRMVATVIGYAFKKKFTVLESTIDRLCAFYDNFKYCLLLDKGNTQSYSKCLTGKVAKLIKEIPNCSENHLQMYLKSQSCLQGADTQVVVGEGKRYSDADGNHRDNSGDFEVQRCKKRTDASEVCSEIEIVERCFSILNSVLMFVKTFTHMQGADAQVVTQSAAASDIDLIMPLSTPDIFKATLAFKDDRKELTRPKYSLKE